MDPQIDNMGTQDTPENRGAPEDDLVRRPRERCSAEGGTQE
jgi:hypothetical protein